jgi:phage repressor protein C with HTH and peptisase S24 domain
VTAPEAETSAQSQGGDDVEQNAEAEEYAEPHGADDGEGYGEKLQPEEVDDAETGDLPDPPEEEEDGEQEGEEGEEEEFVVVEAPRSKPIIPLTGAAAEDTGNGECFAFKFSNLLNPSRAWKDI